MRHEGGCGCGAVRWTLDHARPLPALVPRACDCDFCTARGVAWVSDPDARLAIHAGEADLRRERQGSRQAEFVSCARCGLLVAVVADTGAGGLRGALARNGFDRQEALDAAVAVSPRLLAPGEKRARWGERWTPAEFVDRARAPG